MLRLLAEPEDGQRQEAQRVGQKTRRKGCDRREQFAFGVDRLVRRHPDLKNDQGERDGEHAIGDADDAPASLRRRFERSFHAASPFACSLGTIEERRMRRIQSTRRRALSLCFYACRCPKTAAHFWATYISTTPGLA
jgi:hypothetical protein